MGSQAPSIAFFGSTGGTTNAVLVHALRAGRHVIALVRTPSKLTDQLLAQKFTQETLDAQLTVITGDARDITSVTSTLKAGREDYLVPNIVTGLGITPKIQFNACDPLSFLKMDTIDICGKSSETLISALKEIYAANPALAESKPKLTFVSTTGISDGPEDVPYGLQTVYHKALANPHADKKVMEKLFKSQICTTDNTDVVFSGVIGIRPALLSGGVDADSGIGHEELRAGTEQEPAVGAWMVSRADVGAWMWFNVVGDLDKRKSWENEMVSLIKQ